MYVLIRQGDKSLQQLNGRYGGYFKTEIGWFSKSCNSSATIEL